jgi:hypothetical protein
MGSAVISHIFPPVSRLAASASRAMLWPTFLLSEVLYMEGLVFLLFTNFICHRRCFFFLALAFSSQPLSVSPSHAHQEGCAQSKNGEEG